MPKMNSSLIVATFVILINCLGYGADRGMMPGTDHTSEMNEMRHERDSNEQEEFDKFSSNVRGWNGGVFGVSGMGGANRIRSVTGGITPSSGVSVSRQIGDFDSWVEGRESDNDWFDENDMRGTQSDNRNNWARDEQHEESHNNWFRYQPMSEIDTENTWHSEFGQQDV